MIHILVSSVRTRGWRRPGTCIWTQSRHTHRTWAPSLNWRLDTSRLLMLGLLLEEFTHGSAEAPSVVRPANRGRSVDSVHASHKFESTLRTQKKMPEDCCQSQFRILNEAAQHWFLYSSKVVQLLCLVNHLRLAHRGWPTAHRCSWEGLRQCRV